MYFNEDEKVACAEICLFVSNKRKMKSCWNVFPTKIFQLRKKKKKKNTVLYKRHFLTQQTLTKIFVVEITYFHLLWNVLC
jgi:hypothetical protein